MATSLVDPSPKRPAFAELVTPNGDPMSEHPAYADLIMYLAPYVNSGAAQTDEAWMIELGLLGIKKLASVKKLDADADAFRVTGYIPGQPDLLVDITMTLVVPSVECLPVADEGCDAMYQIEPGIVVRERTGKS